MNRINTTIRNAVTKPAAIALLLVMSGCVADVGDVFQGEESLDNKGTACIVKDQVQVDFGTCLSSSCDTLEGALCTAEMQGDALVITSTATKVTKGNTCTMDCGFASVKCALPAGADKAKTIDYAGNSRPIDTKCSEF